MTDQDRIGLLNEKPLHAGLKGWYAQPGDRFEVPVDGYVIDIVRNDLLIEVQTGNFSSLKAKLADLVTRHRLRLIFPIPREKWIVKLPQESRRKSPKRGRIEELFRELVSFPDLMLEQNFELEVLFIQEEEVRRHEPGRRWRRRGWVTEERRLLDVLERRRFETPTDLVALLPSDLPQPFSTLDLAKAMDGPRWLAQKMAYCLREMAGVQVVGKRGRSILYTSQALET